MLFFFFSLQQHNFMLSYNNLPDLASFHCTDVSAFTYDYVVPNNYHPSLVKDEFFVSIVLSTSLCTILKLFWW